MVSINLTLSSLAKNEKSSNQKLEPKPKIRILILVGKNEKKPKRSPEKGKKEKNPPPLSPYYPTFIINHHSTHYSIHYPLPNLAILPATSEFAEALYFRGEVGEVGQSMEVVEALEPCIDLLYFMLQATTKASTIHNYQ